MSRQIPTADMREARSTLRRHRCSRRGQAPAMAFEVRPAELLAGNSVPAPLAPRGLSARALADARGMEVAGSDRPIDTFGLLSTLRGRCLGYLASDEWLAQSDTVADAVL